MSYTLNGNVWTTVTMPSVPAAPAGLEFQNNAIVSSTTNPFTAAQQFQSWGVTYKEASVSMQPMTAAQAAPWLTFLEGLNGPANCFCFPAGVCAQYPNELTLDGTNPRYWRLKSTQSKWSIQKGSIYAITFEIREVL